MSAEPALEASPENTPSEEPSHDSPKADLDIGGENIDHVVASYKGVFIIEVKNFRGRVLALSSGLYTHGNKRPNSKVTTQVWRQVHALHARLGGQRIQPVLVFLNGVQASKEATGISHSRKIPCLNVEQLVPYLKDQSNALPYKAARRLFGTLDDLTK